MDKLTKAAFIAIGVLLIVVLILILVILFRKPDTSELDYIRQMHATEMQQLKIELDKNEAEKDKLFGLIAPFLEERDSLRNELSVRDNKINHKRKKLKDEKDSPIIIAPSEYDSVFNAILNGHN